MKLQGETVVLIPWIDAEGNHNYQQMRFKGELSYAMLYTQIKRYIKKEFGTSVSKRWIRARCPLVNSKIKSPWDKEHWTAKDFKFDKKQKAMIDVLVRETAEAFPDEIKEIADTEVTKGLTQETEQPVSSLPQNNTESLS